MSDGLRHLLLLRSLNKVNFNFCSSEGEAYGSTSDEGTCGAGDPPVAQDQPSLARAAPEAGAGKDGGPSQGEDREETGQTGAGAQTHPGGLSAG